MARLYVYDDKNSLLHTLIGAVAGFSLTTYPIITILITLVFTMYEATEFENPVSTIGDFTEFFIGVLFGVALENLEVSL